jgi:hypothetical protein
MTSRSQNGWPVVKRSQLDTGDIYPGIEVPGGVLAGDVAIVFRFVARRYNDTVEPLRPGKCWGYAVRPIRGTTNTISNHGSATAVDFNADEHALGDAPEHTFTPAQIAACHAIEAECDHLVAWGGDWSRPDGMHFEIVGTPAQIARLASKIQSMGEDMPSVADIWNAWIGKGVHRTRVEDALARADQNSTAALAEIRAFRKEVQAQRGSSPRSVG